MNLTVGDLVQRFDSGEIRLPLMQRDYVWRAKKVVRLLDSLYRSWPIGSFYVWHTHDDAHPTKARAGRVLQRRLDTLYGFLLDGQQRLTSLSLANQGESETELCHRGFFDLENEQFYLGEMKRSITKRIEALDPLIVPLSDIVSVSSDTESGTLRTVERIIRSLREQEKLGRGKEEPYRERLHKVAKMLSRPALCEEFTDDHEEHAFELFSRLNKGGTSLSAGDVEAARLASAATKKIVEPMRSVVAERDMRALGVNFVFLLRTLVTVHRGNCSFSKLPYSWAADTGEIEASWRRTETALRATVQFVRHELGWTTRRWLPSTMALIPIVYLLAKSGSAARPHGQEAQLLKRYLVITGLRSLFRGSTETTVNTYVNAVRDAKGDRPRLARALFERIPKNRQFKVKKEDVRNTSGLYSPLMQTYLSYLYSNDAKTWPSGRSLKEVLHDGLVNDPLAVHHIFPKQFMQIRDVPIDRLNTVANYAILSQADNAELSDRNPFDAWRDLKPNQREYASAQLCFVASEDKLRPEAYEEFVEFRSEKLAGQLNEFLGLEGH
jgi:hypothetical protein